MKNTRNGWQVESKPVAWPTISPGIKHPAFFYPWHLLPSVVCVTAVNYTAELQQKVEEEN
jgi:hypothetical protein